MIDSEVEKIFKDPKELVELMITILYFKYLGADLTENEKRNLMSEDWHKMTTGLSYEANQEARKHDKYILMKY